MNVLKQTIHLSHDILSNETFDLYYNKIRESVYKTNKLNYVLTRHRNYHPIIMSSLIDNNYVGIKNLREYISSNTVGYVRTTIQMVGREVVIYYVLFNKEDFNLNFEYYTHLIISYIIFCSTFNNKCSKKLTIYLYLTPFKKELNENDTVIGANNVNTGVTYSCINNNEICVYRKEEFLKVLFHELIHSMGLDSKKINSQEFVRKMNETFRVSTTNNYFEAYTEFLAVHYYLMFISFYLGETKNQSLQYLRKLLKNEIYFSMFQMNKVLNHNGLSYDDLVKNVNTNLYKESSNVFAYYILKTIMLYNGNKVFLFFKNKESDLAYFIKGLAYNTKFIEETKLFQKLKSSTYLEKTMRMTIFSSF